MVQFQAKQNMNRINMQQNKQPTGAGVYLKDFTAQ